MKHNETSDPAGWNHEPVEDFVHAHHGQRDSYDMQPPEEIEEFLQNIGAHNNAGLMRLMYQVVVHEDLKNILELGTGVSSTVLGHCALLNGGRFLSIDVENSGHRIPNNGVSHFLQIDHFDVENVTKAMQRMQMLPLDCLFIDGDHSVEGVTKNFEHYAPLVRQGGVIFLHDVSIWAPDKSGWIADSCEVPEFWNKYDFTGYDKFTFLWSNGLGMLRKQ
jgi:predicted O-methyltransferase YrrM